MTADSVVTIFQQALQVIMVLTMITLIPALMVGLLVSMFQAATQINEMTLSFIPKLLVTLATLMIAGPWMLRLILEYTSKLIHDIPYVIG